MIYAGVTADNRGAFALAYGMSGGLHYELFTPDKFKDAMDKVEAMEGRCVIEMPEDDIIETPEKVNPAVFARMYCRGRGMPFMFVKPGSVRRAYNMKDGQTMAEECRLRFPEIELRGLPDQQEETAKAVLLAKYAKRYL